jgi:hypothetical protein
MKSVLMFPLVFVTVFSLDFVWAKYTQAVAGNAAWLAAGTAIVIYALGGVATLGYTSNPWLLLPAVAGAFAGTFTAVRFSGSK